MGICSAASLILKILKWVEIDSFFLQTGGQRVHIPPVFTSVVYFTNTPPLAEGLVFEVLQAKCLYCQLQEHDTLTLWV